MDRYRKTYEISFFETDKDGYISPVSLLKILGETSGDHSEKIGFGAKDLIELNYAWMLNRWKVSIEDYPKAKEKIIIETWTSKIDRFYANREFSFYRQNGELLGKASTIWIFIDMNKKRPIRIPMELANLYTIIKEQNFEEFYDFKSDCIIDEFQEYRIRRSDIDYNNHVNNSIYLSWIIENIPNHIYDNYKLSEFEILYKREAKYGNYIKVGMVELNAEENTIEYLNSIEDEKNEENHALAITKWKK